MSLKSGKSIAIIAGIIVGVCLLGLSGFLLFKGVSELNNTKKKLDESIMILEGYARKKPYPSQENVVLEMKNHDQIKAWFGDLMAGLRKDQVSSDERKPTVFMDMLGKKKQQLAAKAKQSDVKWQEGFGFGFELYFDKDQLPAPNDVSILTEQLIIIENVIDVLLEEQVEKVVSIKRQVFEADATGPTDSTNPLNQQGNQPKAATKVPGVIGPRELFAKQRIEMNFLAKENRIWNILNRFSSHKIFMVVTDLQFSSKYAKSDFAFAVPEVVDSESQATLVRANRIVSGRMFEEPVTVKIVLEVYKFPGE